MRQEEDANDTPAATTPAEPATVLRCSFCGFPEGLIYVNGAELRMARGPEGVTICDDCVTILARHWGILQPLTTELL